MTRKKPAAPVLLTTEELAERWGGKISPRTIEGWRRRRCGPPYQKMGKRNGGGRTRTFYPLDAVVEFERRHRIEPIKELLWDQEIKKTFSSSRQEKRTK